MRVPAVLISLLFLLCGNAMAGGTVGFNSKWYSTGPWPFNDIVDYPGFEATTGIVLADLNRETGFLTWPIAIPAAMMAAPGRCDC